MNTTNPEHLKETFVNFSDSVFSSNDSSPKEVYKDKHCQITIYKNYQDAPDMEHRDKDLLLNYGVVLIDYMCEDGEEHTDAYICKPSQISFIADKTAKRFNPTSNMGDHHE